MNALSQDHASLPAEWFSPPREFSVLPFWFWNDELTETELLRQIEDFVAHGVYGFVIHPRVGLPPEIGWMSPRMLELMRFAVAAAAERGMSVILYDEAMYPSGSSCGQVVAENPAYAVRGLARRVLAQNDEVKLEPEENLVALVPDRHGRRVLVVDRPIDAVIRGIHYIGEGPEEETPPAADLLNPDAVACFVRKVYEKYAANLGEYFGSTVLGIFTDEPGIMGRLRERDVRPGTTGILEHVNRILGYDFTPHLPALWDEEEEEAAHYRAQYDRAVHLRLEETYYATLSNWCLANGTRLMGHPEGPGDLAQEKYFHIPGQDLVWRWVMPLEPNSIEGKESTQAKCSSSAMHHLGRRRNSNECFGAYGHELKYEETVWLVNWCLVRGVNMFIPHAFYYSVRGPRKDERPPDVGPNSAWWDGYLSFAQYCQRLCWLNTDSRHICDVAILGENTLLPWRAAKACFQHQRDFNYICLNDLTDNIQVTAAGFSIGEMEYKALIVDGTTALPAAALAKLQKLAAQGRVLLCATDLDLPGAIRTDPEGLPAALQQVVPADIVATPATPGLRYRHVQKHGADWFYLFNEGAEAIQFTLHGLPHGPRNFLDPWQPQEALVPLENLTLQPGELRVLHISPA